MGGTPGGADESILLTRAEWPNENEDERGERGGGGKEQSAEIQAGLVATVHL